MILKQVTIFTDGACRGNPGPGGWGVVMRCNGFEKVLSGSEEHTTNNRMELMAAIKGLEALNQACHVHIVTDSQYLLKGITEWVANWQHKGWKTADKKPVKNADLWQTLLALEAKHSVEWNWVRGHSGHPENEQADALANAAIDQMLAE